MFEKEAEEYRNNNTNYYEWDSFCADDGEAIETAYQKGTEFGYNKAKEEAKDIINELLMNGYSENTREQALNFYTRIKRSKRCLRKNRKNGLKKYA